MLFLLVNVYFFISTSFEMLTEDADDEDIEILNNRIKELEQQIVKIVEGN